MRKLRILAAGALILVPGLAQAQSLAQDVQCLLLGNGFARQGSTEKMRLSAAMTAAFYLGRVDGRASPDALKAALLGQQHGLAGAAAGKAMQACAVRAADANKRVVAIAQQAAPARR